MRKLLGAAGIAALVFGQMTWGCADSSASRPVAETQVAAPAGDRTGWPASSGPTRPAHEPGVPNFGRLNSDLWRSGQPTREGYQRLAAEGLKTVVNLRDEFPQDKDRIPAGVRYVYIPIRNDHPPTDEQAKEFIDTVADPANWPVLVHCEAGEGRAGTMSALVRHSLDGWDHDKIMAEVTNYRPKTWGFIPSPLAARQQQFIRHWEETPLKGVGDSISAAPGDR